MLDWKSSELLHCVWGQRRIQGRRVRISDTLLSVLYFFLWPLVRHYEYHGQKSAGSYFWYSLSPLQVCLWLLLLVYLAQKKIQWINVLQRGKIQFLRERSSSFSGWSILSAGVGLLFCRQVFLAAGKRTMVNNQGSLRWQFGKVHHVWVSCVGLEGSSGETVLIF